MLPTGPKWRCKELELENETKSAVCLYYQDPLECLQSLLQNPLYTDNLEYAPYYVYESIAKQVHSYTEWLSGNKAWSLQVHINHSYFTLATKIITG